MRVLARAEDLPTREAGWLLGHSELPRKGEERSVKAYHALYAPVQMAGELRIARLVAREDANGVFAYDLQQSNILERSGPAGEAGPEGGWTPATKAGPARTMTVAQIRQAVNAGPLGLRRPAFRLPKLAQGRRNLRR